MRDIRRLPDRLSDQAASGHARNRLISPSFVTSRPVFAHIEKLDCGILLIEATVGVTESRCLFRPRLDVTKRTPGVPT